MAVGWAGTVEQFLAEHESLLMARLSDQHAHYYTRQPGISQRSAWETEVRVLGQSLATIPRAAAWGLLIEYELPFEGGRRVDKIALAGSSVVALEFKETTHVLRADLDQVRAYARDLAEYHSQCRDRTVNPLLVLPNRPDLDESIEGTRVVGPPALSDALTDLAGAGASLPVDDWLNGTYAPLPTLVEAARRVFTDQPLPAIKRAESAGVPELLAWLHTLVDEVRTREERHLVLISGVPGSGKTLVGLQFVHERGEQGRAEAVFLSGNGPLIEVLQHALKGHKVFVKAIRKFILEYGVRTENPPPHNVLVFDEAQRMWDREYVRLQHNHEQSEPDMIASIAGRPKWSVIIGLVGEGQEIYLGEESGIGQWRDAIVRSGIPFVVHAPPHLASAFEDVDLRPNESLNLTFSLRTHRAENVQGWVAAVLAGDIGAASQIAPELRTAGYDIYCTTDLERAKAYTMSRYAEEPDKRYGLLASSKARNLEQLGINNNFFAMQALKIGPWFNAERGDPLSSSSLRMPVTEFQCQGLELDLPIVCWGDDLEWLDGKWVARRVTRKARDSRQLRINSYRVLLSRGRDGAVIYLPPTLRPGQQAALAQFFRLAGVSDLRLG